MIRQRDSPGQCQRSELLGGSHTLRPPSQRVDRRAPWNVKVMHILASFDYSHFSSTRPLTITRQNVYWLFLLTSNLLLTSCTSTTPVQTEPSCGWEHLFHSVRVKFNIVHVLNQFSTKPDSNSSRAGELTQSIGCNLLKVIHSELMTNSPLEDLEVLALSNVDAYQTERISASWNFRGYNWTEKPINLGKVLGRH